MPEQMPDAAIQAAAAVLAQAISDCTGLDCEPSEVHDEAESVLTAAAPHLDPSWRSTAAYRHAVAECINDLAGLAAPMQHPAAQRALYRARELLRARRDGTPPPGRTDIDDDAAREVGL